MTVTSTAEWRNARAAVSPPNPPPTITTRGRCQAGAVATISMSTGALGSLLPSSKNLTRSAFHPEHRARLAPVARAGGYFVRAPDARRSHETTDPRHDID